jgi:polyprenyl-phospho-N-acetylgalactosaminyl synthase
MVRRSGLLQNLIGLALSPSYAGRRDKGLPFARRVLLKLLVAFTRSSTGLRLTDVYNGLRVFTASAARRIRITENRMARASEILDEIARHRLPHIEFSVSIG